MNFNSIKTYLSGRIGTTEILAETDTVLSAYFNTANNLLTTFYDFSSLESEDIQSAIIAEESIFLYNGNIDLEPYYEYNSLISFNIAGAIQGSVDYNQSKPYFSNYVKGLLEYNGISGIISDPSSDIFQTFASV